MRGAATAILVPLLGVVVVGGASGCSGPGDRPEDAVRRLDLALERHDAVALYEALDVGSRWAVEGVWIHHREASTIVAGFPPETVPAADVTRFAQAVAAADPADFFGRILPQLPPPNAPLGALPPLGEATETVVTGDRAIVRTRGGASVELGRDSQGRWGWRGYREVLDAHQREAWVDVLRVRSEEELRRAPR